MIEKKIIFDSMKKEMDSYYQISPDTFQRIVELCNVKVLEKGNLFTKAGITPKVFGYLYAGLMRAFIADEDGNEYNKIFFYENTFPGSMVALLTRSESEFSIEAIETATIVEI